MAPKGRQLKRKSSGGGEPALKKMMVEEGKVVAAALKKSSFPDGAVRLVTEAVGPCLSTYADQRHTYQEKIIEMAGKMLVDVEGKLGSSVSTAAKFLDDLDRTKLQGDIIKEVEKRLAEKTTEAQKEAIVAKANLKYRLAHEALQAKLKEQKAEDVAYNSVKAKKVEVQTAIEQVALTKSSAFSKAEVRSLESLLKKVEVDSSLMSVMVLVLAKAPDTRGEFDRVTQDNLDSELTQKLQAVEAALAPLAPAAQAREEAVASAQAAYDAAKVALQTAKTEHKDSIAAVATAEKTLKAAEDVEKDFDKAVKKAKSEKEDAETELSTFREGPLACYSKLKAQTTPPPPEPEPAEEAPAPVEEAAAEAAA